MYFNAARIANYPEILLPDRPIAFNRDLVRLGIGVKGALLLSQAIYWSKRTKDPQGWFYKTNEEWEEETGLTHEEQRHARSLCISQGFLTVEKRGIPAKNHFLVDTFSIANSLIQSSPFPTTSGGETLGLDVGKTDDILYTESTAKNTHGEVPLRVEKDTEDGKVKKDTRKYPNAKQVFHLWGKYPAHWVNNATQLRAAENLYAEQGLEDIASALKYIKAHQDEEFFPQITSPWELDTKWDKLEAYFKKHA